MSEIKLWIIDERADAVFTDEIDDVSEATLAWERLSEYDKKKRERFYVAAAPADPECPEIPDWKEMDVVKTIK